MSISTIDLIRLTFLSLRGNLLRSTLTTLGVFMGVGAVSATLQVRSIGRAVIAKQLESREAPQARVFADWDPVSRSQAELRLEDLEFLRKRMVGWRGIGTSDLLWGSSVSYRDRQAQEPEVVAVSEDFLETAGRKLVAGRFFNKTDFDKFRPVVVVDEVLVENLFQGEDPLQERIYVDNRPYVVVGVVQSKQMFSWREPQGTALLPIAVYSAITGNRTIDMISIRPENMEDLVNLGEQAIKLLEQRFPGKSFRSWNNVRDIMEQQETLKMVSRSLLAVGGIALLVGGVGIANITIASVMERTAEIGLRRAIGATQRDIMLQFILEAAVLSILGGTVAIVSVHGITTIVADTFKLPYEFDRQAATFALGSALLVGIGAGFLPAMQASKLDPVKALRSG
uniref:ABC transporter permease n=1 Tax=Planktothricoides sp. SpSt-374 TaxID=2282167 RepID=A0A7C3VP88_9CYAN